MRNGSLGKIVAFLHRIKWPIIVLILALTARTWIIRTQVKITNSDKSLFGGEYEDKFFNLVLINNLDKTHETKKISEAAIFKHLLSEDTLNFITALEAKNEPNKNEILEGDKMLKILKSYVNKEEDITDVEFYQTKTQPQDDESHHKFIVFKTIGTGGAGELWWSLEKNKEHFVVQRSSGKGAKNEVIINLEGKPRKSVTKIDEKFEEECTIYDLLRYFVVLGAIGETYPLKGFNCSQLIDFLSENIIDEERESPVPINVTNFFEFSRWHPIVALIYMDEPELVELVYQHGDYDIDGIYNEVTLLNCAIFLSRTRIVDILLNKMKADPTKCDKSGFCPLQMAAFYGKKGFDIMELLLNTNKVGVDYQDEKWGNTALHFAAIASNIEMARYLLDKGTDASVHNKNRETPLHHAVLFCKNTEIIDVLLNNKAVNIDAHDIDGSTALHYAILNSNVQSASHLLDKGANPNIRDNEGRSPIEFAAVMLENMELVDLLLQTGKVNINDGDEKGRTLLHHAASESKSLIARHLMERGADPNAFTPKYTPLHAAATFGKNTEIIDVFLNNGKVNIEARDMLGMTPLHHAIQNSNVLTARHLLDNGADPKVRSNTDESPLGLAARFGEKIELVDLILDTGKVNVNDRDQNGLTALHNAASQSNVLIARHLMKRGADPNAHGVKNDTPLHMAAFLGENTEILDLFLDIKNVNIEQRNSLGWTPLYCAVLNSNALTARYLIEKGANPKGMTELEQTMLHTVAKYANKQEIIDLFLHYFDVDERNENSETPLHFAATESNVFSARHLIKRGANPKARDIDGRSVLDKAAMSNNDTEIIDLLFETGKVHANDFDEETGLTALHNAAFKSNALTARHLLVNGANPKAINTYNNNALHVAARFATNTEIIDVLLNWLDIDGRADENRTSLHFAVMTSNVLTIRYLIKRGADPNARDIYGRTPLLLAAILAEDEKIIELLLDLQANVYDRDDDGKNILYYLNINYDKIPLKSIINFLIKRLGHKAMAKLRN